MTRSTVRQTQPNNVILLHHNYINILGNEGGDLNSPSHFLCSQISAPICTSHRAHAIAPPMSQSL